MMQRRTVNLGDGPQAIQFNLSGKDTTQFPHPEISDHLRAGLTGAGDPGIMALAVRKKLAEAYDAGWKDGRKLRPNTNPFA